VDQHATEYLKHSVHGVHPQCGFSPLKVGDKTRADSCKFGQFALGQADCLPPLTHKGSDHLRAFVDNTHCVALSC
jgi:hypothetical protein